MAESVCGRWWWAVIEEAGVFWKLALLFIGLPALELYVLAQLGKAMGVLPTVGVVLVTGVVGAALARGQGARAVRRIQEALAAGRLPGKEALDGVLVFVAALLMITPGVITDVTGLLLLIPPLRALAGGWLGAYLKKRFRLAVASPLRGFAERGDEGGVIETEARKTEE